MSPSMTSKRPASALELLNNGFYRFPLFLAVGLLRLRPALGICLSPVAQNTLIACQTQTALGPKGRELRVFPNKLIKNRDGVQVLGDHLIALRVLPPAPDQPVIPQDELVCKAVF